MDFPAVFAMLNDLPGTFVPAGAPYSQFATSFANSMALYTEGADTTATMVNTFVNAVDGWLDVWGLLFGIPRQLNESNALYSSRIKNTVIAWVGTLPAIQVWLNLYASGGTVAELSPGPGYTLNLPAGMTLSQIEAFLASFNRIRPDGVPFIVSQSGGGLYLGTEEYFGSGTLAGSYLTGLPASIPPEAGATTLNSVPLLPSLYMTDPILNPPT